jgi:hypothetical protein
VFTFNFFIIKCLIITLSNNRKIIIYVYILQSCISTPKTNDSALNYSNICPGVVAQLTALKIDCITRDLKQNNLEGFLFYACFIRFEGLLSKRNIVCYVVCVTGVCVTCLNVKEIF